MHEQCAGTDVSQKNKEQARKQGNKETKIKDLP